MIFLEQLNRQIEEQTRNGRQDVYINAEDLKKLNPNIQPLGDRIYIKKEILQEMIDKYEAKQKPDFKIKKRLINVLKGQLNIVKDDAHLTEQEKNEQFDIIFKTMTFIANYEKTKNKTSVRDDNSEMEK